MMPLRRPDSFCWIAALIVALTFIGLDSSSRIAHLEMLRHVPGTLVSAPAVDLRSPTGYESGLREAVLPLQAIDGYHWIMQTQQMFATGDLRIRHVDYDNSPDGREVHWASPFRWWIGLLAWIEHQITGHPIGLCVESAGLYANPALLALFLIVLVPLAARRIGSVPAAWLAVSIIGAIPLADYFQTGNPDHHGLAAACALVTVLGIAFAGGGITSSGESYATASAPPLERARRWFRISGVAGGCGLWISSASQAPVLVALGIGSLWAAFGYIAKTDETRMHAPDLWRTWGRWGAATSVIAYLIEYLPSHFGWRLEVNHPLYALAWWGGAELLRLAWQSPSFKNLLTAGLQRPAFWAALGAVALLPAVVVFGGSRVFRISDHFLWALHHEYIGEFQNVWSFFSTGGRGPMFAGTLFPWLLVIPVAIAWRKKHITGAARAALTIVAVPLAIYALMATEQVRWIGFALMLLGLLVVVYRWSTPAAGNAANHRWLSRAFLAWALLSVSPTVYRAWLIHSLPPGASRTEVTELATREVAWWLARRTGSQTPVVASSPGLSTKLAYHGGARALGTLYWENLDGLEASAAFFGAHSEEEAHRIARATGLTHLVLVSWSDFAEAYVKLIRGLKKTDPAPDDAFVLNLLRDKLPPPWLRPVACVLPANPGLDEATAFVYEVVPPQTREESLVSLVHFLIDSGNLAEAAKFLPALDQYPTDLPAQICRARLQLQLEQKPAFVATMRAMLGQRVSTLSLSLENRIHFALLLAVVGADREAAAEFSQCWSVAADDENQLRHLSAAAIQYLLQQSARLGITVPAHQQTLARSLLPPQWLSQLASAP